MRSKDQGNKSAKMPKALFVLCIIAIAGYVLYQRGYIPRLAILYQGEGMTLQYVGDIIETDSSRRQEFLVNQNQLVWITEDGVKALSLEGEELWADTHTIKNIAVAQSAPYFAVGEKSGRKISIFDTHGKKADLNFSSSVVYFSMNKRGDIVVVESTEDGHVVSAYDERGNSLGVKRITYVQDVGYPITAEISPDGKIIVISYLNTDNAKVSSNLIGVAIESGGLTKVDNILYGRVYDNTVISEIEFINDNTWIATGDNSMIVSKIDGQEIKKIDGIYFNYTTIFEKSVDWQGAYYAVVASDKPTMATVHPVEKLIFYSSEGESITESILNNPVTYMYGDGRTTVVGSDRKFTAYNKLGKKRWEYTATKDIQKVIPLYPQQRVVLISRGKAELMQIVK